MLQSATEESQNPASLFVTHGIERRGIRVRFDYSVEIHGQKTSAENASDVHVVIRRLPVALSDVLDDLLSTGTMLGLRARDIKAAFQRYVIASAWADFVKTMEPLLNVEQGHCKTSAALEWRKVSSLFEGNEDLVIAVFQSLVWAVKQKAIHRPVTRHLVPVIYSHIQGLGKTTFARRFIAPLKDLASDGALFSDLVDRRSADIFRYSVLLLDDMEILQKRDIPKVKAVITGKALRRRILGTSMSTSIRQQCVFIGTSNRTIDELVPDPTGNRRFVQLNFRNADAVQGGDETLWDVVNSIDYELLWLSVDPFGPNPIEQQLNALREHQQRSVAPTPLLLWLQSLDLESEDMRNAANKRGYRADMVRDLFMSQSGEEISANRFSDLMSLYAGRSESPLGHKVRTADGQVYLRKQKNGTG